MEFHFENMNQISFDTITDYQIILARNNLYKICAWKKSLHFDQNEMKTIQNRLNLKYELHCLVFIPYIKTQNFYRIRIFPIILFKVKCWMHICE